MPFYTNVLFEDSSNQRPIYTSYCLLPRLFALLETSEVGECLAINVRDRYIHIRVIHGCKVECQDNSKDGREGDRNQGCVSRARGPILL